MILVLPLPAVSVRWLRQSRTDSSFPRSGNELGPPINQLYYSRRLSLVRLATLMVDDVPTAEDVVQDVFAAMYRRYGADLRALDDPDAYLRTGVMNAARSVLRRRRVARAFVPAPPGVAPAAEDEALLGHSGEKLLAAMQRLTIRQRQVMVLRYWSELTEQEIAETLQVSCGTVKSTANRAMTILRNQFQGNR